MILFFLPFPKLASAKIRPALFSVFMPFLLGINWDILLGSVLYSTYKTVFTQLGNMIVLQWKL